MVAFFDSISPQLAAWVEKQPVFFTASAPLTGKHINVSPKGLPASTFRILSPTRVAYIDATGSGSETISHIYENGRVTVMFCSFDQKPMILRLFCFGRVVEWDQPEFECLLKTMAKDGIEGARAAIVLDVWKVQTSCGYGVPKLGLLHPRSADGAKVVAGFQDRETLGHWASKKVEDNVLNAYRKQWNVDSLDGLTGLRTARRDRGEILWLTDLQAWCRRIWGQKEAVAFGFVLALLLLGISWGFQGREIF